MAYDRLVRLMVLALTAILLLPTAGFAQSAPEGRVILIVGGEISNANVDDTMQFDRAMLEAFDLHTVVTETPWTDGDVTFEGVLLRDILDAVGATGNTIAAVALNDYTATIPASDADDYDVILAMRQNGARLTVRERGPLWVIYPWSDVPNIQNEVYYSRAIWQLKAIEVRPN